MISPAKGKAKEESHWSSGWWEYYALLQNQRPLVWSSTSTIFSAHPTQPLVIARHFSSSKQFVLQSPPTILATPSSYEPPTVISVAPGGDWVFAYFPGGEIDGIGCLWQRGSPIDIWVMKECWPLKRGAGIVAASWLGGPREWTVDDSASAFRLPPRGPRTPITNPTLILVTEACHVAVCYLRAYLTPFKIVSHPLAEPGSIGEVQSTPLQKTTPSETLNRFGGLKVCSRAAIGLAYDEHTIMVATRSRVLPSPSPAPRDSSLNSMNMALPLELDMPPSDPESPIEWEAWGEDPSIELSTVRLDFDGTMMTLSVKPLPPLHRPALGLTNLVFIPSPPLPKIVTPSMSQTTSGKVVMYLAATYLDFGDYTSRPKSELVLHSLSRVSESRQSNDNGALLWTCSHEATRSFTDSVLTFALPNVSRQSSSTFGLLVGILQSSGSLPRGVKEVPIGAARMLRLPSLRNHERWESASIMSSVDTAGRELPLNAALSFNNALLCTTSSSPGPSQMSLHMVPKLVKPAPDSGLVPPLTFPLANTLLSGTTAADLSHILSLPSVPLDEVAESLYQAMVITRDHPDKSTLTSRSLGLVVETYRVRARKAESVGDREILEARWQTALDVCSLMSCNTAFEDCKEGDSFDLDAVWQLVGLSAWVVSLLEKLLKECVLASDPTVARHDQGQGDDLFGSVPSSPAFESQSASIVLLLAHPHALKNLHTALSHVTSFRSKIGSLSPSEENSQMAKSILVDLIDCSGVDLNALEPVLSDLLAETKRFSVEETQRSLALCQPTNLMRSHLRNAIDKLAFPPIVDKPRLFIKPFELMDGVPRLFDHDGHRKDRARDIISKGTLNGRTRGVICVRCGGKTEIGGNMGVAGHISTKWLSWERMHHKRCICGGLWSLASQ
ncbi:hypothetical protein C8J57DRAFT_1285700 [Mycena rebaudengoi]|nr:hypothetical protein C8J57DRAFT_1285700 [Mycena rebaudengoi]